MKDIKLAPCPFCNGSAFVDSIRRFSRARYWVECRSCKSTGALSKTAQGAIAAWNTRPYLAAYNEMQDRVSALESRIGRLTDVCGAAYQMAGTVEAPERFLDALSDPFSLTEQQVEDLLPVTLDEFGWRGGK